MTRYAIPPLIGSIAFFSLGLFVLFNKPRTFTKTLFAILCLETFYWQIVWFFSFFTRDSNTLTYFSKMAYLTILPLPFTYYHFVVAYFKKVNERKFVWLFYGASLILMTLIFLTSWFITGNQQFYWGNFPKVGPLYIIFVLLALVSMLRGLSIIIQELTKEDEPQNKNVKKYFLLGFCFYFFCALDFLQAYGVSWYPIGSLFFLLSFLTITYAITRYQLLDIQIVIKKTVYYSLLTALISSIYFAIIFLVQQIALSQENLGVGMDWALFREKIFKLSGLLAFVTNIGIAVFVFAKQRHNLLARKFGVLSLFIGFWAVGSFVVNLNISEPLALFILRVHYSFGVFVPVLFLDFISQLLDRKFKTWLKTGYILSTLLVIILQTHYFIPALNILIPYHFRMSQPGPAYILFISFFSIYFLKAFLTMWQKFQVTSSSQEKTKILYVFFAYFVGMLAGLEYFSTVFGFFKRPPLDDYILIITFLILAYTIFKHELLDIKIVIRKTLIYSLIASLLSAFYIFLIFTFYTLFTREQPSMTYLFNSAIIVTLITFFLRPVDIYFRGLLDKKFFKGTISQISEQKEKLETELERRERLKSVGILAAGMAHEIKNPLTAIKTFTNYLPDKFEDPVFREKFTRIVGEEVGRIQKIVTDLLLFSKPTEPNPKACDINEILKNVTELLSNEIFKKKIHLTFHWADNAMAFVDPDQMKQVFLNLILNAIQAMSDRQGGELTIATQMVGQKLLITISDTGCGIPAEKLPHIFDPFYTSKEGGTGLGLAIAYSIIEKNHGKISATSLVDSGSSFKIEIDLKSTTI